MFYKKSKDFTDAGKTLLWCPMDTEELYKENLVINYKHLKQYGWIDRKITYTFNQHGYRSIEFNDKPNIVFLGCSYTQGIGIPIEDSWTSIISNELNLQNFNFGLGGSSADTAFRIFYHWYRILKPSIVVLMTPYKERLEIIKDDKIIHMIPRQYENSYKNFYNDWVLNETNGICNQRKNALAIEFLCTKIQAKFIEVPVEEIQSKNPKIDLARDLRHPGTKTNVLWAEYILQKI